MIVTNKRIIISKVITSIPLEEITNIKSFNNKLKKIGDNEMYKNLEKHLKE